MDSPALVLASAKLLRVTNKESKNSYCLFQLKDIEAQKQFFGTLDKTIDDFPKDFCIHKVLPQLLNAYEFSTAGSSVLSPLFKVSFFFRSWTICFLLSFS